MEVATTRELINPTLPVLLVAGLIVFYVLRRLPPSLFALPVLSHLHLLNPLPHRRCTGWRAVHHGPLPYLRLGSMAAITACSSDTAHEVLKPHEAAFLDRPKLTAVHRLTYGGQDFSAYVSVSYWRFMKRAYVYELLPGRTLERLRHVRRVEVSRLVGSLSRSAGDGTAVDMEPCSWVSWATSYHLAGKRIDAVHGKFDAMIRWTKKKIEPREKRNWKTPRWTTSLA